MPSDDIRIHPCAEALPMLSDEDLQQLAEDIRRHGLRDPIVLLRTGSGRTHLLDGRNRLAACKRAGVEPRFVTVEPEEIGDPAVFVWSKNLVRRNLNGAQRAIVAARLFPKPPHGKSQLVAIQAGVSTEFYRLARAVVLANPHLAERVMRNEIPLRVAYRQVAPSAEKNPSADLQQGSIGRAAEQAADEEGVTNRPASMSEMSPGPTSVDDDDSRNAPTLEEGTQSACEVEGSRSSSREQKNVERRLSGDTRRTESPPTSTATAELQHDRTRLNGALTAIASIKARPEELVAAFGKPGAAFAMFERALAYLQALDDAADSPRKD